MAYDGVVDDEDAYVQGHTVPFKAKDFLHIKEVRLRVSYYLETR